MSTEKMRQLTPVIIEQKLGVPFETLSKAQVHLAKMVIDVNHAHWDAMSDLERHKAWEDYNRLNELQGKQAVTNPIKVRRRLSLLN